MKRVNENKARKRAARFVRSYFSLHWTRNNDPYANGETRVSRFARRMASGGLRMRNYDGCDCRRQFTLPRRDRRFGFEREQISGAFDESEIDLQYQTPWEEWCDWCDFVSDYAYADELRRTESDWRKKSSTLLLEYDDDDFAADLEYDEMPHYLRPQR